MQALSSLQQALLFIVQNLFQIYIIIVLLRCLLQIAKADFYNPVSQAVVKLTTPPLRPLRKLIPSFRGIDSASLVLAFILYYVLLIASFSISYAQPIIWFGFIGLFHCLAGVIYAIVNIYFFAIIIAAISSWIPPLMNNPLVALIWQLVEPVQAPFRKLLPDLGGIDISPLIALLILQVLRILLLPYVLI